jgi:hypothetical protein
MNAIATYLVASFVKIPSLPKITRFLNTTRELKEPGQLLAQKALLYHHERSHASHVASEVHLSQLGYSL